MYSITIGLKKTDGGNVVTNQFYIEQDTKILIPIYPETLLRLTLLNKPSYNNHLMDYVMKI